MLFPPIAQPLKEFFISTKKQKQKPKKAVFFVIKMAQKRELWSEKECLALLSAYGTEEI
jgi:hypothetical protein